MPMIIDAYYDRKKAEVMQDTWGHLRPEPGCKYPGEIVYTLGEYGDITVIRSDFGDFSGGPWFAEDESNFVCDQIEDTPRGSVFRWRGYYQKFKNGRCRFVGKTEQVIIPRN